MRYTEIDNVFVISRRAMRPTRDVDRADIEEAYELGASEKPMAEQATAVNEEGVTLKALYGLMLGGKWHSQLKTDIDGALYELEQALVNHSKMYDEQR